MKNSFCIFFLFNFQTSGLSLNVLYQEINVNLVYLLVIQPDSKGELSVCFILTTKFLNAQTFSIRTCFFNTWYWSPNTVNLKKKNKLHNSFFFITSSNDYRWMETGFPLLQNSTEQLLLEMNHYLYNDAGTW